MPPTKSQTILLVEDEASLASFVSLYLKHAGYVAKTAATGAEAMQHLAAGAPELIVLDLMLPDVDGIELCRRVRQRWDVPILMLTARDEDIDKIIGLEVGADDYMTKPFNPRELVARDTRTVDVHVRQLRRKLGDASPIVTVWGVGYKVSPSRDAVSA